MVWAYTYGLFQTTNIHWFCLSSFRIVHRLDHAHCQQPMQHFTATTRSTNWRVFLFLYASEWVQQVFMTVGFYRRLSLEWIQSHNALLTHSNLHTLHTHWLQSDWGLKWTTWRGKNKTPHFRWQIIYVDTETLAGLQNMHNSNNKWILG